MCIELPGRVTALNAALAEVESEGERRWYNALAQPDVQVGDWVTTHANMIVAILTEHEAHEMMSLAAEMDDLLSAWEDELSEARSSARAGAAPPANE